MPAKKNEASAIGIIGGSGLYQIEGFTDKTEHSGKVEVEHKVVTDFDRARALAAFIAKTRVTVLTGAPTVYQSMLMSPSHTTADLSSLRLAVTGAATVPP